MTVQNDKSDSAEPKRIQVHISPDLDYSYRDIAKVFASASDVLIEFGNYHRSLPGNVTISNRIVLSMSKAYELQRALAEALVDVQKKHQRNSQK